MAANRHALHATPEGAELLRPDERNILLAIGLVEQFLQQKHQVYWLKLGTDTSESLQEFLPAQVLGKLVGLKV